jgi:hypothetical protein
MELGMKIIFLFLNLIIIPKSWGVLASGALNCPQEFEGRIKDIVSLPLKGLIKKNQVIFEVSKVIKGEFPSVISIEVIKDGPFQIFSQRDYRVYLRAEKVCWIEEI